MPARRPGGIAEGVGGFSKGFPWERVDAGASAYRVPQRVRGLLEGIPRRLRRRGRRAAGRRRRGRRRAAGTRPRGHRTAAPAAAPAAGPATAAAASARGAAARACAPRRPRACFLLLRPPCGKWVRLVRYGICHGLLPQRRRGRIDKRRRRRELLEEVRLGGAQLVCLRPLARLSVRPILREFSFVVVLLLLARRGRRSDVVDARRLLLDARAALGGALREALGASLRHGLLSRLPPLP